MKRSQIITPFLLISLFLVSLAGCAFSGNSFERQLTTSDERIYSDQEAQKIFNQVAAEAKFNSNQLTHDSRISRIVDRLARTSHARNVPFTAYVVDDPNPNAFSIGGKHVFVTQGMINLIGYQEDELAGMLAHEIAHDLAGHQNRQTGLGVVNLANTLVQHLASSDGLKVASDGAYLFYSTGYSRTQEEEADILGTVYAYRAGFDPDGFVNFFNHMQKTKATGYLTQFVSSHPHTPARAERVRNVSQYLRRQITMEQLDKRDSFAAKVMTSIERVDRLSA